MTDDVPAAIKRRRRERLMARQQRIVAAAQEARIGTEVRLLIDGPSREHELVLQGRLEGQAPDIDPVVYLTDCDPSELAAGNLIQARRSSARSGYDLLARRSPDARRSCGRATSAWTGLTAVLLYC